MNSSANTFIEFDWWVPQTGFAWVEPSGDGKTVSLQPRHYANFLKSGKRYSLHQKTGLWIELARTSPTRDEILKFANKHGGLFSDRGRPEILGEWQDEILMLKEVYELWLFSSPVKESDLDKLEKKELANRKELGNRIEWMEGKPRLKTLGNPAGAVADPILPLRWKGIPERPFKEGDLIGPAMARVVGLVNSRLEVVNSLHIAEVCPQICLDETSGELVGRLDPRTLRAALWVQAWAAITGKRSYYSCDCCGRPFEVSSGAARGDKKFCSGACRSKKYRKGKKEVIKDEEKGKKGKGSTRKKKGVGS